MAMYPAYNQILGSTPTGVDDRVIDQDVFGTVHIRGFYPARMSQFMIKHVLTPDEWLSLLAFYDANRMTIFDFEWHVDSTIYACVFANVPKMVPNDPGLYEVTVELRQQS
jgi:hypothetical protein